MRSIYEVASMQRRVGFRFGVHMYKLWAGKLAKETGIMECAGGSGGRDDGFHSSRWPRDFKGVVSIDGP